ncbi:MAG: response regulator [Pseudomonadota bacterium]
MKALVIDDEPILRQLIKLNLESLGLAVETSVNGAEAFGLLQRFDYDLVVSDINMPLMNGIQLYRLIAERLPHLTGRFVFCTGSGVEHEIFFKESNRPLLYKPFTLTDFKKAVACITGDVFFDRAAFGFQVLPGSMAKACA